MAKKSSELTVNWSRERKERVAARTKKIIEEMPLHELRRAMEMSQETLAELLDLDQPSVSKIEHQADMLVSTLRKYLEALGGELEIVAKLPTGTVRIRRFDDVHDEDSFVSSTGTIRRRPANRA